MNVLGAALAIVACLALEALLARAAPGIHGHLDVMMVLVAWYALGRSQRSAMLVGCAAGLLQDAWFQIGVFGMNGFRKTLLGWALGGLASRLDLNHVPGRVVGGALLVVGDELIALALYRFLDLDTAPVRPLAIVLRAALVGLLVAAAFPAVERLRPRRAS